MFLALAQTNPRLGEFDRNLEEMAALIHEARLREARLIVFPEAAVTGYAYRSREEALESISPDLASGTIETISRACGESLVLLGLIEKEGGGLVNSAFLISSQGLLARYRKSHLPYLGVDRFVTPGAKPPLVVETPFARLGILICYELRFPEVARSLALQGADLICNITNWPRGAEANPSYIARTRAAENRVFVASCNRCGVERGVQFIGQSQLIDPQGKTMAQAGEGEEVLYASLDISQARNKRIINSPGEYELDIFNDRKPRLYTVLTEE